MIHRFFILLIGSIMALPIDSEAQVPMPFSDGYRLIDEEGDPYPNEVFDYVDYRSSDMYMAVKNGMFGYLNHSGKQQISFSYDIAYPFTGEFALVGKSGKYYHISKGGKKLDTLDHPWKPNVLYKRYLVKNRDGYGAVYNSRGELMYETGNMLFATGDSRLVEWNKQDSIAIFGVLNDQQMAFNETKRIEHVIEVATTEQGVPLLKVMNEGQAEIQVHHRYTSEPLRQSEEGIWWRGIQVFGTWVYVPEDGSQYNYDFEQTTGKRMYSSEHFRDLQWGSRAAFALEYPEDYEKHSFVKLRGLDKWVRFSGRDLKDNVMYDELRNGDQWGKFQPARRAEQWVVIHDGEEIEVPFTVLHPGPIWSSVVFGRNPLDDEGFQTFDVLTGELSEERFEIPINNVRRPSEELKPTAYTESFNWLSNDLAVVHQDGKAVLINKSGEIIKRSDVPYKPMAKLKEFRILKLSQSLREGPSVKSFEGKIRREFSKKSPSLFLSTEKDSLVLHILNNTKEDLNISVQDGAPEAHLEYLRYGKWERMTRTEGAFCGNSFYERELKAGGSKISKLGFTRGEEYIKVRMAMADPKSTFEPVWIYSNEVEINVNAAILWVDDYFPPFGR